MLTGLEQNIFQLKLQITCPGKYCLQQNHCDSGGARLQLLTANQYSTKYKEVPGHAAVIEERERVNELERQKK